MAGRAERPLQGGHRMPGWLRRPVYCGGEMNKVSSILERERLNTVCAGAKCPNRGECFSAGTATFMIMGERCTRSCRFCAVPTGGVGALDEGEPARLASAAAELGLRHVVITSVTRDDLPDGGASHFVHAINAVRERLSSATVEVLVPDFQGQEKAIDAVIAACPEIFNHNVETVRRLYGEIRPEADYSRTLRLLSQVADAGLPAKSGFMLGLSETVDEVEELMIDLYEAGCRLLTVGQYLRPGRENTPVDRYWSPSEFDHIASRATEIGFAAVASGPFVRSSYNAGEMCELFMR